jgi:hypothetical protein
MSIIAECGKVYSPFPPEIFIFKIYRVINLKSVCDIEYDKHASVFLTDYNSSLTGHLEDRSGAEILLVPVYNDSAQFSGFKLVHKDDFTTKGMHL